MTHTKFAIFHYKSQVYTSVRKKRKIIFSYPTIYSSITSSAKFGMPTSRLRPFLIIAPTLAGAQNIPRHTSFHNPPFPINVAHPLCIPRNINAQAYRSLYTSLYIACTAPYGSPRQDLPPREPSARAEITSANLAGVRGARGRDRAEDISRGSRANRDIFREMHAVRAYIGCGERKTRMRRAFTPSVRSRVSVQCAAAADCFDTFFASGEICAFFRPHGSCGFRFLRS